MAASAVATASVAVAVIVVAVDLSSLDVATRVSFTSVLAVAVSLPVADALRLFAAPSAATEFAALDPQAVSDKISADVKANAVIFFFIMLPSFLSVLYKMKSLLCCRSVLFCFDCVFVVMSAIIKEDYV
jgi:hypothetical protein